MQALYDPLRYFQGYNGQLLFLAAIFVLFGVWGLSGIGRPQPSIYAAKLSLSPEETQRLFRPARDRLYGFLDKVRCVCMVLTGAGLLALQFLPAVSGQAAFATGLQVAWIGMVASLALTRLFRARTAAKVRRLGNINNFYRDPVTGKAPSSGNIYSGEIFLSRTVGFVTVTALAIYLAYIIAPLVQKAL